MEELTTIQSKIYEIRGQRVMLDFDLAPLYQVQTKVLKQAVRRNIERFPADFMFEITIDEYNSLKDSLRSQIVTSNKGGTRYMPFAFTEQGVSMLSSVLRSDAAIQVNIAVMRAFVAMRNYITTTTTLTAELSEIRAKLALLERTDEDNAKALILRLAAEQYAALGDEEYETNRLRHLFSAFECVAELNADLLKSTVSEVLVTRQNVKLRLKNGQVIERSDLQ